MRNFLLILLLLVTPVFAAEPTTKPARTFMTGFDSNYRVEMEKSGKTWSTADGKPTDPFKLLAANGCDSFRVRLWTGDDGVNGLQYATETAKLAQAAGLKPYVVIFLSENWSDMVKQPLPAIWKDLSNEDKLRAIEAYTERVARHFSDAGVKVELFEIGNEIDFGICGVFEEEWPKRVSLEYMRSQIWSKMSPIISAAQRGVRKVNPDAKFLLHLAQWNSPDYSAAFFKYMIDSGVTLDYAGLSYFPTSVKTEESSLDVFASRVKTIHDVVGRPIVICEYAFPSLPKFGGQFADWDKPVKGFESNEAGQAAWISAFLSSVRANPMIAGAYYWSPEWYGSNMWEAFALFGDGGKAKPAAASFVPTGASQQSAANPPKPAEIPVDPKARERFYAVAKSAGVSVYFGNLHSHTSYSDGSGTPEEAYKYARDVAQIDFLAITDHNHLMGGADATPEKRKSLYEGPPDSAVIPVANRFNENGKFVALYGQEYSSMSQGNHVNVFDVPAVIDVKNGDFAGLLKWMDAHPDSTGAEPILQFNHPGLGRPGVMIDKKTYGRDDFGDDAGWVKNMGRVACLIEVLNGDPPKGALGKYSDQLFEAHYLAYLQAGFRVAPTGDQDNHKPDWGTLTEVRTGILAPELTKPALLAAMRARHVYSTGDRNLKLIVRYNGHLAGDVITNNEPLTNVTAEIAIDDRDEPAAVYTIEIFAGTVGGKTAEIVKSVSSREDVVRIDGLSLTQSGQFLFAKINQRGDGRPDHAWTAPVWFELAGKGGKL